MWTPRYSRRPQFTVFGEAHGGPIQTNLEAMIQRVWRGYWRPWLWHCGRGNWKSMKNNWVAEIEWTLGGTWRQQLGKNGGTRETGRSGSSSLGGRYDSCWDYFHSLTCPHGDGQRRVYQGSLRDERWEIIAQRRETGCERQTVHLGVMQYLVYTVLRTCFICSMLYSLCAVLGVYYTGCMM